MAFKWNKGAGYATWKDKVDYELVEIRQQLTVMQEQLKTLMEGKGISSEPSKKSTETTPDKTTSDTGVDKEDEEFGQNTQAMREYMVASRATMLITRQMGLPDDIAQQTVMLYEGIRTVYEFTTALNLLMAAEDIAAGPIGVFGAGGLGFVSILRFGGTR